ncbi:hypothetical protein JMJ56_17705 [Belnapia sp. T18]|uniref:WsaF C-terminal domain-containing protein n=1 Tax=Belnapia arida TaxID=2804533 RepID=A0ABS1U5B5_9PROT|nr:hypothetical protein [Belnapia arida]MBL6079858.1 hypothetical protein [Belnapia arida]
MNVSLRPRPALLPRLDALSPLTTGLGERDDLLAAEVERIEASGLFDAQWFAERHPEAAGDPAGVVAWQLREAPLQPPHPLFDVAHYTAANPGWQERAATPLGHYVLAGAAAGASPHPLFDPAWYAAQVPGIPPAGLFHHYLSEGFAAGLTPHPAFDPDFYLGQAPELRAARVNPLTHFVEAGWAHGLSPNRLFDVSWYAARHPEAAALGLNPLVHFLTRGIAAGAAPHPGIDLVACAAEYPEAPAEPLALYRHLLTDGADRISDGNLAAARDAAASAASAAAPPAPIRVVIDLEDYGTEAGPADRLPQRRPTPAPAPLLAAIASAGRVSFDIWDTLLRRDCHPDEIKLQSARLLKLRGQAFLRDQEATPATLLTLRLEAEAAVARAGHEFRFPEAADVWLWRALVPSTPPAALATLRQALLDHEFAAERRATRPDAIARELLRAAAGRAGYASDFYMPDGFMDRLLAAHGMDDGFLSRHVSCDSFETKRGGQLFPRILAEAGLPAQEVLHVGDNLEADVEMPRRHGLRSLRYVSPAEESRKAWFGEAFEALRGGDAGPHHRRILGLLEDLARAAPDADTAAGIRLSLFAFGFCLNAAEGALAAGAETLWFFTREGAFLREVHEAIRAADPFNLALPESSLLEVSRLATFGPSLPEFSAEALMRLWSLYGTQSMAGLAASLNLDAALMRRVAERHGLAADRPVRYPWKSPAVLRILEDAELRAAAGERLGGQRALLRAYLAERGFTPGATPRHCVDIGWRGTIQDNIALVSGAPTVGWYLGLFGFLNPQPPRSRKHGWLGNENLPGQGFALDEVAGLEMLFNAPGGSVRDYAEEGGRVVARRAPIPGEEAVIRGPVAAMQRGMLQAVAPLADYIRLHGLVAADLLPLARRLAQSLADRPPVADAFAALEHDETFGTGRSDKVGGAPLPARLEGKARGRLLEAARAGTTGLRWPAAALRTGEVRAWLDGIGPARRAALPTAFTLAHGPALLRGPGDRLGVYAPAPIRGSGGHRTLFNLARRLGALGWRLDVFLEGVGEGVEVAEHYLAGTSAVIHTQWHRHIACDLALATIAHSARFVAELPEARTRAYLVQDLEALFNPVSDAYLWNEASYTYGLRHITIGHWLSHLLRRQYATDAVPAGLGCDTALYRPRPEIAREEAVCFLYQPDKPRRTPQHGIHALRLLKQARPDVTIYVYGSDLPIALDFPVVNLGLMLDLGRLAELCARCKVGLCISASNPSRIPFEMMAAGCVPVDLYRYNNLLDHRAGTAVLAFDGEYSLAQAMQALLDDPAGWARRSAACMEDAAERSLDWEVEAAANHVLDLARGLPACPDWPCPPPYAEPPVVAAQEDRPGVRAFLRWQAEQAATRPGPAGEGG